MIVDLDDGTALYANTGGQDFDPSQPVVVLIHGAGCDHTTWRGQTRYLAHHGFSPLAIDLPGHGRSGGKHGETIEARSEAVLGLLDALDVERAVVVGHSMGSLAALDLAGRWPARASGLVLVATSPRMAVHPVLIESAEAGDDRCLELTRAWQHGRAAGGDPVPGEWRAMVDWRTTEAVGLDVYADDFIACKSWTGAADRAAAVTCPALVVSGSADRMTGEEGGAVLADLLGCRHVVLDVGHMIPAEAPWPFTRLLTDFLTKPGL